jgi:hypothetical protein
MVEAAISSITRRRGDWVRWRPVAAASARATAVTIEIGGAVVPAAPGVDPAWLRDVLRAVKGSDMIAVPAASANLPALAGGDWGFAFCQRFSVFSGCE